MSDNKNIAPIIITGMHNSGIGMITHYLKNMGVFVGSQVISNDPKQVHGYLEDVDFEKLHSEFLNSAYAGCKNGWPDWGYCKDKEFNGNIVDVYAEPAKELVEKRKEIGIQWGWADSRTTLLLDFWDSVNPDNKYVFVYRNPWEVKKAILDMDVEVFNKNPDYILDIWKLYNKAIVDYCKKHPENTALISFNSFLKEPSSVYTTVKNKLGIELNEEFKNDYSFYVKDIPGTSGTLDYLNEVKQDKECWDLLLELNNIAALPGYVKEEKSTLPLNKVAVIIATYNDAFLMDDALCSIEQMKERDYEVIIVNDGTTDKEALDKLKELRSKGYKILDKENGGDNSAKNLGIKNTNAEYILILDSDDTIQPGYIEEAVEILEKEPEVGVVYCNPRYSGKMHRFEQLPDFSLTRLLSRNFISATSVIRKSAWEQAGGFDEALRGFGDWELWINIASKGWKFHHINKYYFEYRLNVTSKTPKNSIPENRYNLLKHITTKHAELYKEHAPEIVSLLNKEHAEAMTIIHNSNQHIENLNSMMHQGGESNLSNKLGRFKELLKKVKHILSSPMYAPEDKNKWLQRFKFLFSSRGVMLMRKFFKVLFKYAYILLEHQKVTILLGDKVGTQSKDRQYSYWILKNAPREKDFDHYAELQSMLAYRPKISIIMPVFDPPVEYFIEAIDSILDQIYDNWELCISDDVSRNPKVRELIKNYAEKDERIKFVFREKNGHISANTNSALSIASGEFLAFFDHDDLLTKDALYQMVVKLNTYKDADFIYSDEDKVDDGGYLSEPHFKPDWSPDNLLTRNYINHFTIIRKTLVDQVGGFREGFEGSQDHDLFLRVTELTNKVHHIPRVLYHWRMHSGSAASNTGSKNYATIAGEKAVKEALERRKYPGNVKTHNHPGFYNIRLNIKEQKRVSIIIPSKDKADILEVCLSSIYAKTSYKNFEVILIDNNSSEGSFFKLVEKYKQEPNFRYFKHDIPFNYAQLMNYAVEKSEGEYMLLLNNDTEVINPDWIECMVEHVQRKEIGVVGAKLLYPNNTIQHAGVILGLCGLASHTFVGEPRNGVGYFNYLNVISNYSAVTGACMMFRRDVYDEVGGFDEKFAVEYNDIDFCLKVKDKGYNNLYLPDVILYHHESISRGNPMLNKKSIERHLYEVDRFKSKWNKYVEHDPCYNPNLSKDKVNFEIGV